MFNSIWNFRTGVILLADLQCMVNLPSGEIYHAWNCSILNRRCSEKLEIETGQFKIDSGSVLSNYVLVLKRREAWNYTYIYL